MKVANGVYMATTIPNDESKAYTVLVIEAGEEMEILEANEWGHLRMAYLRSGDKRLYDMLAFYGCQGGLPMPGVDTHP